jgi:hypothetical protein
LKISKIISNPIVKTLVYANVFISICALAQVIVTYVVFSIPVNYNNNAYLAFVFLSTYLQYNVQRGYLINQNNLNSERTQWLVKHKKTLLMSVALCLISVLFLCNNLSSTSITIMVAAEIISTLYYLPPFNLRKHGYIKPFLISVIWVISCSVVPLIENHILTSHTAWFLISQFCFISVLCLLFDFKDNVEDFLNGVNTYSNKFGALISKVICLVILVIGSISFYVFTQNMYLLVAMNLVYFTTALTVLISKEKSHGFYYYLWVDGLLLLQGIVFYFVIKNNEIHLSSLLHNL